MKMKALVALLLTGVLLFSLVAGTVCYAREFLFDQQLKKVVVMYLNKSNALVYGVKQYMSDDRTVMPYLENNTIMMPVAFFAKTLSGSVTIDGNQASVTVNEKTARFDTVKGPGEADYAALTKLCKTFELKIYTEKNGVFAYSAQEMAEYFDWTKYPAKMREMLEAFVYDDVTGEEMYSLLVSNNPDKNHPRIMITEEKVAAIREEIQAENGDAVYKTLYEQLLKEADVYLDKKVSVHELRDGIRLLYVSQEALSRIQACALAYLLSGEEKYAECAYAELEAVCAFPNWNPRHFLDVGVMSMAVAFGYDWLYDWMTPDQREYIRNAAKKNAMDTVMDDINGRGNRTYRWLKDGNVNNWRCVNGGGVGTLMLSMMDEFEGDTLAQSQLILQKMLEALRPEMLYWGPMGAFEEGHGYWQFAMSGYTPFIMSLEMNTGSNFGYVDLPGLNLTNQYLIAINGPARAFGYHVAGEAETTLYPYMLYLADRMGKLAEALPRVDRIMGMTSNVDADIDILLYSTEMSEIEQGELANDAYFPVTEIATMRTGHDSEDTAVFFHCDKLCDLGGADTEHMDAGVFSLQALGEQWFFDMDSDNYNISNLAQSYRFRAEGHNTVIFNPDAGYAMKKNGNGFISDHRFGEDYSYAVANMTDVYNAEEGVESFQRGVMLDKKTGYVTIQDEIRVKDPVELYWFAHTRAVIAISQNGKTATLTQGDSYLRAYIVSGEGATFCDMPAEPLPTSPVVPDQMVNHDIRKLAIHIESTDDIDLCVVFVTSDKLTKLNLRDYTFRQIADWDQDDASADTTQGNDDGATDTNTTVTNTDDVTTDAVSPERNGAIVGIVVGAVVVVAVAVTLVFVAKKKKK